MYIHPDYALATMALALLAAVLMIWEVSKRASSLELRAARLQKDNDTLHLALRRIRAACEGRGSVSSGINLAFHLQSTRAVAHDLATHGVDVLEHVPEIAWRLMAIDDYLQGIALASSSIDPRIIDAGYDQAWLPLTPYIRRADI